jgi:putative DNA primase/helicase
MTTSDDQNPGRGFRRHCDEADLARLAGLTTFEYARVRKQEADAFKIGVNWLDKAVADFRKKSAEPARPKVPTPEKWKVEPWEEPVDGAELLDDLRATFERYVILPEHGAGTMALWIMHAWTIDAAHASPFLMLTSPEMRCGKTTALKLLNRCAPRTAMASNVSPAAIFRYIEAYKPTLLIDEADTFAVRNDELRGILNSGHTRDTAIVIRLVGDSHEPCEFSTWAPKAIASIGKLAATLRDRAIVLAMHRKNPGEWVAKLRSRDDDHEFLDLRRKACRWAADHLETLKTARPEIPDSLNDRAADNWEPLLAIADLAGAHWPELARAAAKRLSDAAETDSASMRIQLLGDIRRIFDALNVDRISSKTLVAELASDEDGPWATYGNGGRPIAAKQVARLLSDFGIRSKTMRVSGQLAKAYSADSFDDAWRRYLPDTLVSSVTREQTIEVNNLDEFRAVTLDPSVADGNSHKSLKNNDCYDVTGAEPISRGSNSRQCIQCCGRLDGTERPHTIGVREVWLHPECKPFWTEGGGWGVRR